MEMFMLPVALVAALGGMFALAFRVVRFPLSKRGARPAATSKQVAKKVDPREPTQALLTHMEEEYTRHTQALRHARDLRRSRSEAEAFSRLLDERVFMIKAARKLGSFAQPSLVGRLFQWGDLARLDLLVETVLRENADFRTPPATTRRLAGARGVSRWITWARGGPETGAAYLLERYHYDQRDRYRRNIADARRIAHERRTADALTHLANEQAQCVRVVHAVQRDLQSLVVGGSNSNA